MAAANGSAVGAGRSQSLPDRAGRHRRHACRTGATATGRSLSTLRGSGGDVNGPRHALVEYARAVRANAVVALAHAAGYSAVLERHSTSANPRQGGTFSRIVATSLGAARNAGRQPASLAGCVSLGAQPRATARSARHADSGDNVEAQSPSLRCPSATLGISGWSVGVESGLLGKIEIKGKKWKI